MQRTIELTEAQDKELQALARRTGQNVESLLTSLAALLGQADVERDARLERWLDGRVGDVHTGATSFNSLEPIQSTHKVMGGVACIRRTRIPVWLLVSYKSQGMTDSQLLQEYPGLNASDLVAAWDYFASHASEIESQIREQEGAA